MKIHPLSTHPCAEGGTVGWSVRVHKTLSGVNSVAAKFHTIEVSGGHVFKRTKTTEKKHKMPPYCSCDVLQVSSCPDIALIRFVLFNNVPQQPQPDQGETSGQEICDVFAKQKDNKRDIS